MLTRLAYLVIAVVVGLAAIFVSQLTRGRLVEATSVVTQPAQTAASAPFGFLGGLFGGFQDTTQLRQENEALRAEVDRLRQQTVRLPEIEHENQILREQANYRKTRPDQKTLSAWVIGRDPNPLLDAVVIDQGTSAGVSDGMVVVTPAGLVGRIERAGPSSSKVLLLTDTASAVNSVVQSSSRPRGVLESSESGALVLRFVGQNESVQVGDQVVTSGLGGMFPSGLLVGKVADVKKTDADLVQAVTVKPAVDFDNLESVLVITSFTPARLD
jgi:rod shape-determining protein MreC